MSEPSRKGPGYTCGNIDSFKDELKSLFEDVEGLLKTDCVNLEYDITSILSNKERLFSLAEDCRDDNCELRDWAHEWIEHFDEEMQD